MMIFPVFLILYEFCVNMSNDMYLPAMPKIAHDFATSANLVQMTIVAWLAGDTAFQLLCGPLSDRFGRRPILFIGGLIFLISTLGCSLAPSITFLIVARFFQGISVCTMMVAGYASIHDLYDDQKAIHILAWMGSAAVIAPAVGPVLGSLVLSFAGWRMVFYLLFFLAVIALLGLGFVMPESVTDRTRQRLHLRTLFHAYKTVLATPAFITSAATFGLLYGGVIGWITASPFLLMESLHLSPITFGWLQGIIFIMYIIGAQLVKPIMKRIGKEKLILIGLVIASCSSVCLIVLSLVVERHVASYILPMMGYCLGFGLTSAPLNRTILTSTSEQKGVTIAVFYLMMTGAGTLIGFLLSLIDENALLISCVIAASILLALILNCVRHSFKISSSD